MSRPFHVRLPVRHFFALRPLPLRRSQTGLPTVRILCGAALGTLVALTACTRIPQLEDRLPPELAGKPYPYLLPLGTALAAHPSPLQDGAALSDSLDSRAAQLRKRAEALRRRTP